MINELQVNRFLFGVIFLKVSNVITSNAEIILCSSDGLLALTASNVSFINSSLSKNKGSGLVLTSVKNIISSINI